MRRLCLAVLLRRNQGGLRVARDQTTPVEEPEPVGDAILLEKREERLKTAHVHCGIDEVDERRTGDDPCFPWGREIDVRGARVITRRVRREWMRAIERVRGSADDDQIGEIRPERAENALEKCVEVGADQSHPRALKCGMRIESRMNSACSCPRTGW